MKTSDRAGNHILKPFFLSFFLVLLLTGCGGGGKTGPNPPISSPTTSLQGSAFIPTAGTTAKTTTSMKLLPGTGPFVGATAKAVSLQDGTTQTGSVSVGENGQFVIDGVKPGQDYLVTVKRGNILLMKIISIPSDAGSPFLIGELDAASTATVLMVENILEDKLGEEINLLTGNPSGVSGEVLTEIVATDPDTINDRIRLIVEGHVDSSGSPINTTDLVTVGSNVVNMDQVVDVNVYVLVFNVLNAGDTTANENGLDALTDWLNNGSVGGNNVSGTTVQVRVDQNGIHVTIETNGLTPSVLDQNFQTLADPETRILAPTPKALSNSRSAIFTFESDQPGGTFECAIDGSGFTPCTSPKVDINNLSDGNHTFLVAAIDAGVNKDKTPARYSWEVDGTKPETTIDSNPPLMTKDPSATFAFSSNEAGGSFECKINDGAFLSCASPKVYPALAEAAHTFLVRAIDPQGNADATPASYSWAIDQTPPLTTIDLKPARFTRKTTAEFIFSANETGSSFECKREGGVFSPCTTPKVYTALSDGTYHFEVKAIDPAGNPDSTQVLYDWTVDTLAPDTIIDLPLPSNASSSSFTFHATETGSSFKCKLDGDPWTPCSSPQSYPGLSNANHTFMVEASDEAGNPDPTPANHSWIVSSLGTVIDSGASNLTNQTSAVFTFHATVPGSTFECQLDAGAWSACTTPKTYTLLSDGARTFKVRSIGPLGGVDLAPPTKTWTIDSTRPDTVLDTFPSNPTTETTATFTFHATELAAFECELRKGGVVISALSACTSPKTYVALALSPPDYHFEVKATDLAGNVDLSLALHDWTIVEPCIFCDDFESGQGNWTIENGVWEFGTPTAGPAGCIEGTQCAGTVLNGVYPTNDDSRLISQEITLPSVFGPEEIHLHFQNWFSYDTREDDWGQVQVRILDAASGLWGTWKDEGTRVQDESIVWTTKNIDLTAYAGKTIQIAFNHVSDAFSNSRTGWYIDNLLVVKKTPEFTGTFENGLDDWFPDRGLWQVGTPAAGPLGCFNGSQCAGVVLDGNYPLSTDSRLVSATKTLEPIAGDEEIHLRFMNWFSYGDTETREWGEVQVRVFDAITKTWGAWTPEGETVSIKSELWSAKSVDLTAYADKTIQIAFYHSATWISALSAGWYIDDIQIVKKAPEFTGTFENGWDDWYTDRGIWQVGTPAKGPENCVEGTQCVGTVLDGNYPPNTDSRLISATKTLTTVAGNEEIHLRFQNWFAYADFGSHQGEVQVRVFNSTTGTWGAWAKEGLIVTTESRVWSIKSIELTAYAGKTIQIAFFHDISNGDIKPGWYIDDIQILKKVPVFTGNFEPGWNDWSADRGVWQVGMPTAGPVGCNGASQCAGTALNGGAPVDTDSRLISATMSLPFAPSPQHVHIRFESWFSYAFFDSGFVEIQWFDPDTQVWSRWQWIGSTGDVSGNSPGWIIKDARLNVFYAGKTVRIAFNHSSNGFSGSLSPGWYIKNIGIVVF